MSADDLELADASDVEAAIVYVARLRPTCACHPITIAADAAGYACMTCWAPVVRREAEA